MATVKECSQKAITGLGVNFTTELIWMRLLMASA